MESCWRASRSVAQQSSQLECTLPGGRAGGPSIADLEEGGQHSGQPASDLCTLSAGDRPREGRPHLRYPSRHSGSRSSSVHLTKALLADCPGKNACPEARRPAGGLELPAAAPSPSVSEEDQAGAGVSAIHPPPPDNGQESGTCSLLLNYL